MFDLTGRTALVTGATGGIGGAIARALHGQGATVAISGTRREALDALAADLGKRTHVLPCNLADKDAVEGLVPKAEEAIGQVDILVNNAGITRDTMFHRMTPEQWNAVINTNLNSLFNMCRPVIDGMRERSFGRIVNVSSINGQKGQMGQSNYSAAKAGEIGFTKALAQENARKGVTVNAICPGYIGTEMVRAVPKDVLEKSILPQIPVGRLGEPEEIARCVVFLVSDDSGFITGSTLTANGGQYMV
jgi:acetoacetyl-CoA reductase